MSEVSVIVLTYNASWNKLRMTLNSILLQKNVDFQIIIADDGSKTKWDDEIRGLFAGYNFTDFVIANLPVNGGTVKNLYNGLKYADGSYIKPISPGDFFYNDTALSSWVQFMKSNGSLFSFGDAVYYNDLVINDSIEVDISASTNSIPDSGNTNLSTSAHNSCEPENSGKSDFTNLFQINIVAACAAPAHRDLFKKPQDRKKVFENYLLANDTILGASIMAESNLYKKYVEKNVGRLIYAEDYLARLLVFDGIVIDYYEEPVIWYEYGTGSSSGVNEKWVALLHKDFEESNRIILESENCFDELSKKYISFLKESSGSGLMHKLKKCAAFPGLVTARLDKNGGAVTPTDVDKQFLSEII